MLTHSHTFSGEPTCFTNCEFIIACLAGFPHC